MFERYTEKARRTIFFARYEASQFGSPEIDTEHLLLGLLRENRFLFHWLTHVNMQSIRQRIEALSPVREKTSTAVDLPLTTAAKRTLKFAADEADRLGHRQIGTEHLLLGLLDEESGLAAQILRGYGADEAELRKKFAEMEQIRGRASGELLLGSLASQVHRAGSRSLSAETVEIHGERRNADHVRDCVIQLRACKLHWLKKSWKPRDVVIEKKTGLRSFDLTLASDDANFERIPAGWRKDKCLICHWELSESQDDHGTGYTNGHDWLCTECYEKFWQRPDFFSSTYPEMT
jgi:hypothetical protein